MWGLAIILSMKVVNFIWLTAEWTKFSTTPKCNSRLGWKKSDHSVVNQMNITCYFDNFVALHQNSHCCLERGLLWNISWYITEVQDDPFSACAVSRCELNFSSITDSGQGHGQVMERDAEIPTQPWGSRSRSFRQSQEGQLRSLRLKMSNFFLCWVDVTPWRVCGWTEIQVSKRRGRSWKAIQVEVMDVD